MRKSVPSLAFGRAPKPAREKPKGISAKLFYGLFAALVGSNVLTGVGFLMSPEISVLMSGRNDQVLSAYEDRIAQLRVEVDRLHSRHYAQAGDINLQLQELARQQEVLTEQHQYVKLLAEKASELGIDTPAALPAKPEDSDDSDQAALPTESLATPGTPKAEIDQTSAAIDQMMGDTQLALDALSAAATTSTDEIMTALHGIGIKPKLPDAEAVGGPFLPPEDGADATSIVDDANAVMGALTRYKAAREVLDVVPIHPPLAGSFRISSGYGNRTDPFTHGKAFHAGLDLPQPLGTTVLAAGDGVVSFAGVKSGYGNLVEIDHGGGLISRYGHLSAFLVKEGQTVRTGTPIARVGSTGRSTGPHLHFEMHRNGQVVDPQPFLKVGKRLLRYFV